MHVLRTTCSTPCRAASGPPRELPQSETGNIQHFYFRRSTQAGLRPARSSIFQSTISSHPKSPCLAAHRPPPMRTFAPTLISTRETAFRDTFRDSRAKSFLAHPTQECADARRECVILMKTWKRCPIFFHPGGMKAISQGRAAHPGFPVAVRFATPEGSQRRQSTYWGSYSIPNQCRPEHGRRRVGGPSQTRLMPPEQGMLSGPLVAFPGSVPPSGYASHQLRNSAASPLPLGYLRPRIANNFLRRLWTLDFWRTTIVRCGSRQDTNTWSWQR